MDNKILRLIPVIRDGKKVSKVKTLLNKVLTPALPFCAAVKIIQGTWQVLSDKKGVIALARKNTKIGNELPNGKENTETLDSIVVSAMFDTLQNNKKIYKDLDCLTGERGLKKISDETLLAAYAATMSSLMELSDDIQKLFNALKGRYIELLNERGKQVASANK